MDTRMGLSVADRKITRQKLKEKKKEKNKKLRKTIFSVFDRIFYPKC